ncbi:MAG: hypothetical protein GY853_08360 [PVC group bacterium]|nr:hypothetical protein [PVC group bacterium]
MSVDISGKHKLVLFTLVGLIIVQFFCPINQAYALSPNINVHKDVFIQGYKHFLDIEIKGRQKSDSREVFLAERVKEMVRSAIALHEKKQRKRKKNLEEQSNLNIAFLFEKIVKNGDKILKKAREINRRLSRVKTYKMALSVLREYSSRPTQMQQEALVLIKEDIMPELNFEEIFFIDDHSVLVHALHFNWANSFARVITFTENDDSNTGIIFLKKKQMGTMFSVLDSLVHEEWHKRGRIENKGGINRVLSEGIVTYLEKKDMEKILKGSSKVTDKIKEEIMSDRFPKTGIFNFAGTVYLESNDPTVLFRLCNSYPGELLFVEKLMDKFGEEFIKECFFRGDVDSLKEKMGKKFDIISKFFARENKYPEYLERTMFYVANQILDSAKGAERYVEAWEIFASVVEDVMHDPEFLEEDSFKIMEKFEIFGLTDKYIYKLLQGGVSSDKILTMIKKDMLKILVKEKSSFAIMQDNFKLFKKILSESSLVLEQAI